MLVSRQDFTISSGQDATFEWQLRNSDGSPRNINTDTIDMFFSYGPERTAHIQKTSLPGAHFNAADGRVRTTLTHGDNPAVRTTTTWWYEVWLTPDASTERHQRIVGEITVVSTNRR